MKTNLETIKGSFSGTTVLTTIDARQMFSLSIVAQESTNVNDGTLLVEVSNSADNETPVWATLESITITKNTKAIKAYADMAYGRIRISLTSASAATFSINICGKFI